jgi:hypothetical protein
MPNLQSVQIKILNGVVQSGTAVSYDLSCGTPEVPKKLAKVNVLINGAYFQETFPTTGSIVVTKIFNCDGTFDYALDDIAKLESLLIADPCCINEPYGASCDKPLFIKNCDVVPPTPVIRHDVEYVENQATGFLDKVTYTWIDGVLQPLVTVQTTYTLETKPKDVEVSTVCNTTTGFYDLIERIYNSDGTLSTQTITATTIGCLEAAPAPLQLQSGGVSIASGTLAATLGPDGVDWTNAGNLKSITIRARRSNTNNALPGNGNQVIITTSINKVVLLTNESATYSVQDDNIQSLQRVDCIGNSAALIIYNFI